jgi:site-specific DNA-methyltransferase (adenine-specific)/modification methylase
MKVEIGDATLYLGDCMEILPTLDKVDAIITDPPYGIKRFEKGFGATRFKGHDVEKNGLTWDKAPDKKFFDMLLKKGDKSIIWGANNFELPTSEYFLVWDKQQTVSNFASAELAYTNIKIPAKVFRFSIHQHNKIEKDHPTQKPLALMAWCIKQADNPKTILDPFMGSGTTGVAAIEAGCKFIGIEKEPKYFDIACKRIKQARLQIDMFIEPIKHEQIALI